MKVTYSICWLHVQVDAEPTEISIKQDISDTRVRLSFRPRNDHFAGWSVAIRLPEPAIDSGGPRIWHVFRIPDAARRAVWFCECLSGDIYDVYSDRKLSASGTALNEHAGPGFQFLNLVYDRMLLF